MTAPLILLTVGCVGCWWSRASFEQRVAVTAGVVVIAWWTFLALVASGVLL